MDSWSFRLANLLVGNSSGDAGIECQFIGPELRFLEDCIIAITGADMQPKIDDKPCAMWESILIKTGQTLEMSYAASGARSYLAVAGGISVDAALGSRATFDAAGIGGVDGHALKEGQKIKSGTHRGLVFGQRVLTESRPEISTNCSWEIEVVAGPNDDWIDQEGHDRFLNSEWKVSAKSNRMGMRLEGPDWTFAEKAFTKLPENGSEPANIIDQGYPIGAINLAGQTPIILLNDGPSMGGFINPYTVPQCSIWKLGQARPGEIFVFKVISVSEAQEKAREIKLLCSEKSLVS
tara:strand:- start:690 stop:1568 length:879 start_codon:yes stop_codon:yes gene_type:complete